MPHIESSVHVSENFLEGIEFGFVESSLSSSNNTKGISYFRHVFSSSSSSSSSSPPPPFPPERPLRLQGQPSPVCSGYQVCSDRDVKVTISPASTTDVRNA